MATLSTNLKLILLALGESAYGAFADWGAVTNDNLSNLEEAISSKEDITVTVADVTMTDAQARSIYLNLTGVMTANRNLIVPTREKLYFVSNLTTGGFTLTVKTAAGTGINLINGQCMLVYCDGTNVLSVNGWSYTTNANGVSLRHPSGIQICFARLTGSNTGSTSSGSVAPYVSASGGYGSWTYPQSFKASTTPFAIGFTDNGSNVTTYKRWIMGDAIDNVTLSYAKAGMEKTGANDDFTNLFAIGFWR